MAISSILVDRLIVDCCSACFERCASSTRSSLEGAAASASASATHAEECENEAAVAQRVIDTRAVRLSSNKRLQLSSMFKKKTSPLPRAVAVAAASRCPCNYNSLV